MVSEALVGGLIDAWMSSCWRYGVIDLTNVMGEVDGMGLSRRGMRRGRISLILRKPRMRLIIAQRTGVREGLIPPSFVCPRRTRKSPRSGWQSRRTSMSIRSRCGGTFAAVPVPPATSLITGGESHAQLNCRRRPTGAARRHAPHGLREDPLPEHRPELLP